MISKQSVRLADVFLIGPIVIYAGFKIGLKSWLGMALILIGLGTIVYNGVNYLKN